MKFTVKHALVVAVCALCVCVVATGTVVGVSLGRRTAEAASPVTIRIVQGNNPNATWTTNVAWSHLSQGVTQAPTQTVSVFPGKTLSIDLPTWLPGLDGIGFTHFGHPTVHAVPESLTPIPLNLPFGPSNFLRAAVGRWEVVFTLANSNVTNLSQLTPTTSSLTLRFYDRGLPVGGWSADQTLWLGLGPVTEHPTSIPSFAITRVVNNVAQTPQTVTAGWRMSGVIGSTGWTTTEPGSGIVTPIIPAPTVAQQTASGGTFRGWSVVNPETGLTLLHFPVSLPVPIFSDVRLYAVFT